MAEKYTVAGASTSTAKRLAGANTSIQLSDGTHVWIDYDPATPSWKLRCTLNRTAVTDIATLANFKTGPVSDGSALLALCRDAADNLYVVGQDSAAATTIRLQAFTKNAGLSWTSHTATTKDESAGNVTSRALAAVWCNTGSGTSNAGHILVTRSVTPGANSKVYSTWDAGALLAGSASTQTSTTSHAVTNDAGIEYFVDLEPDGFGALTVIAAYLYNGSTGLIGITTVTVTTAGVVSVATPNTVSNGGGALVDERVRVIRYGSDAWVVLFPAMTGASNGRIIGQRVNAAGLVGSAAAYGALTDVLITPSMAWDALQDPAVANRVWVVVRSSATTNKVYRIGCTLTSSVAWDAATTTEDTLSTGTILAVRAVKRAVSGTNVDWMARLQNGTTYSVVGDYSNFYAIPNAPTLTDPPNASYRDLAAGYTFQWTPNFPVLIDTQAAYALRRKIVGAGSYEYWNAGTTAWQGTIVWNTTGSSSLVFPSGKWTNGNNYQWSVAVQGTQGPGGAGSQGPFATDIVVTASTPPTVTITAPVGTATSSTPTVAWTRTLQAGASQTNYRVVVESGAYGATPGAGTSVYDSGVIGAADLSRVIGAALVNNTSYRVFVQITETGGQTSSWATSTFVTSFAPPARPVIVAVWDSTLARAAVTVQGRDNIVSLNQSSIEVDAGGWANNGNATVAKSTAQAADGAASLAITTVATGDAQARINPIGTFALPVVAGDTYMAVASFRAATVPRQVNVAIQWKLADGTTGISTVNGALTADNTAGWQQAVCTAVAPAGAAFAWVVLVTKSGAAGEVHYADQIGLIPLGTVNDYGYGVNLLDGTDFEGGTDGWVNDSATLTQDTTHAYVGRNALKVGPTAVAFSGTQSPWVPLSSGTVYTASAWVYSASAITVRGVMQAPGPGYETLGGTTPTFAIPANTWTRISHTGSAPITSNYTFHVDNNTTNSTVPFWVDAVKVEVGSAATPFVPRTYSNLVSNPSFEIDLAGWTGSSGSPTVSRSTERAYVGSASLKAVSTTAGSMRVVAQSSAYVPVVAGQVVTFSFYAYAATRDQSISPQVQFYAADGTTPVGGLTSSSPAMPPTTQGVWTRVYSTLTVPAGAALAAMYLFVGSTTIGDTVYFDAAQIVLGNDPLPYIDGSLYGGSWDSANNLLSAQDSSLESAGVGSWLLITAAAGTLANSTAQAFSGTHSLLLTMGTGAFDHAKVTAGLAPSTVYTVSAYVRPSTTTPLDICYRDAANNRIAISTTGALVANAWQRIVYTFTTTATAGAWVDFGYENGGHPASGNTVYIDAVQVEQRSYATLYAAAGTPNASTSTRQPVWGPGGLAGPTVTAYRVERSDDAGVTWQLVRGAAAVPPDSTGNQRAVVYDYETPPNTARRYRATTRTLDGMLTSPVAVSTPDVTADLDGAWLKDVADPSRNVALSCLDGISPTRNRTTAVLNPLGATYPVVQTDARQARGFTVSVTPATQAEDDAIGELLDDTSEVLLLQRPPADLSWRGFNAYVVIAGDDTETPLGAVDSDITTRSFPVVEVAAPALA